MGRQFIPGYITHLMQAGLFSTKTGNGWEPVITLGARQTQYVIN